MESMYQEGSWGTHALLLEERTRGVERIRDLYQIIKLSVREEAQW